MLSASLPHAIHKLNRLFASLASLVPLRNCDNEVSVSSTVAFTSIAFYKKTSVECVCNIFTLPDALQQHESTGSGQKKSRTIFYICEIL